VIIAVKAIFPPEKIAIGAGGTENRTEQLLS
jgi:hypothetical protein